MHPLAYARGSVTLAESTRLLPSRDRQGAVSSEIPKTFKNTTSAAQTSLQPGAANLARSDVLPSRSSPAFRAGVQHGCQRAESPAVHGCRALPAVRRGMGPGRSEERRVGK